MTTFLKAITLAALLATAAHAGGPVVTEEPALPELRPQGDGAWIVPVIIGAVILCAIACGSDDAEPSAPPAPVPPAPVCFNDGGC